MACYISDHLTNKLLNKYIFLDNDVLNLIIKSPDFYNTVKELFTENSFCLVDPITKLEFLRDMYAPAEISIREQLLAESEFITIATNHHEVFNKIWENSLILSKIYKHQKSPEAASLADLLLAGRIMYHADKALLATGNKKDFPSCVFDCLGIINHELENGTLKTFAILQFNKDKFQKSFNALIKIQP